MNVFVTQVQNVKSNVQQATESAVKQTEKVKGSFSGIKNVISKLKIGEHLKEFSKQAFNLAKDYQTSMQQVNSVMGNSSDVFNQWVDQNALSFNMSKADAMSYASSYGTFLSSFMGSTSGVATYTKELLQSTAVIASSTGQSMEEVMNGIQSAISGGSNSLQQFGIDMSSSAMESSQAFKDIAGNASFESMNAETQQQIRLMSILEQSNASFGNSVSQNANSSLAYFLAIVKDIALNVGNAFMPIFNVVMPILSGLALKISQVTSYIATFMSVLFGKFQMSNPFASVSQGASDTANNASNLGSSISSGLDQATDSANKTAKALGSLAGFDDLNIISAGDSSGGGGGSNGSSGGGSVGSFTFDDSSFGTFTDKTGAMVAQVEEQFKRLAEIFKAIWDSAPIQSFVGFVSSLFGFLFDLLGSLGNSFFTNWSISWEGMKDNVSLGLANISELWTMFWTDMKIGINTWGKPIIDAITLLFDSIWKTAIDPALQFIATLWADFTGILVSLWDEYGARLIDNIGEFITNIIKLFQKIYDDIIEPFITPFLERLSWLWEKHIKSLVEEVGRFIGTVVNAALEFYNKFVQPLIEYLIDDLAPTWSFFSNLVMGVFGTIFGVVADVVGGIIKLFRGIIEFLGGVFSGDWEAAWEGLKTVFEGIGDGLKGIFKGVINIIIDVLNSFIAGINKIKFDIPNWVPVIGGKKFRFDLQKIDKYATGGIVDSATLAVIGESGQEAVIPLKNNTQGLDMIANLLMDRMAFNQPNGPYVINVMLEDGTILAKKVIDNMKDYQKKTGKPIFSY